MHRSEVQLCHWCQEDPALEGNDLCYMCYSLTTVSWDEDGRMQQKKEEEDNPLKLWTKIIGDGGQGPVPMWQEARDFVNEKLLPRGVAPERIQMSYGGYLNKEFLPSMPHSLVQIVVVTYFADHEY